MADANQMLMSGGGIACKFPAIGHEYTGTVLNIGEPFQQTNQQTKELLTFADGSPRMQFAVTLATSARGSFDENGDSVDVPDDNGVRTLYVKNRVMVAIRDAIINAGGKGLNEGDLLTITRVKNTGLKNKKMYEYAAKWVPAAENPQKANAALMGKGGSEDENPFA